MVRLQLYLLVLQVIKLPAAFDYRPPVAGDASERGVPVGHGFEEEAVESVEAGVFFAEVLIKDGVVDAFAESAYFVWVVGVDCRSPQLPTWRDSYLRCSVASLFKLRSLSITVAC